MTMIPPPNHGYYKAGDAMRPSGANGRTRASSQALRAERDRVRDERADHPGFLARFVRRFRHRS